MPELTTFYHLRPHTHTEYTDTYVEIDRHPHHYSTPIDVAEREYRARFRPAHEEVHLRPGYKNYVYEETVNGQAASPVFKETVKVTEETIDPPNPNLAEQRAKMGYHDEEGELFQHRH